MSWLQQAAPAFGFAEQLLSQLDEVANSDIDQYHLLSACVDFINVFGICAQESTSTLFAPEVRHTSLLQHAISLLVYSSGGRNRFHMCVIVRQCLPHMFCIRGHFVGLCDNSIAWEMSHFQLETCATHVM